MKTVTALQDRFVFLKKTIFFLGDSIYIRFNFMNTNPYNRDHDEIHRFDSDLFATSKYNMLCNKTIFVKLYSKELNSIKLHLCMLVFPDQKTEKKRKNVLMMGCV